jgi:hypothetical protein
LPGGILYESYDEAQRAAADATRDSHKSFDKACYVVVRVHVLIVGDTVIPLQQSEKPIELKRAVN